MSEEPDSLIYCFVMLLQGKLKLGDEVVPVLGRIPHKVTVPSAVVMRETGTGEVDSLLGGYSEALPTSDPHYVGGKKYVTHGRFLTESKGCIGIYLTALTEGNRTTLLNQVNQILGLSRIYHYSCCTKYNPETEVCSQTGVKCDALTVVNRYSYSGRCPYCPVTDEAESNYRGPKSYFYDANIDIGSLVVGEPQFMEDTTITPELYGAICKVNFDYYVATDYPVKPGFTVEGSEEVR